MKPKSKIRVALFIDSWLPGEKRIGTIAGTQIHVKNITKVLSESSDVDFDFYYPAYDTFLYRIFWPIITLTRLRKQHKAHPYHLLHGHGLTSSMIVSFASKMLNLPTIITIHGTQAIDLKQKNPKSWLYKKIFTQTKFSAQISVSSSFLQYPNLNKNISIIPNGVDVTTFDAIKADKSTNPSLIWVGSNHPSKGITILRQAIVKVRKKFPDLEARLISGGDLTGKALIKAYKKAHLFVLPSLAEGQPIALLEAWAAKLPVVATSVGDNPKMVKDGKNGFLVEPGNVVQLADAIQKILRARSKDITMGEAGYQMVKKHYTWKKTAAATLKVYKSIITNSSTH